MNPMQKSVLGATALVVLSACAAPAPTAGGATPSAAPTALGTASPSPSPSPSADVAKLDPCQLVTQKEASQLAGATFDAGKLEVVSEHSKMCTYSAKAGNVFEVIVAVAPDAATAQADWAKEEAEAQASLQKAAGEVGASMTVNTSDTSLDGADRAATASASGTTNGHHLSIAAIYALKGRVFFTFSDLVLDNPAPTTAQLEQQAHTVLTRV